MRLFNDDVAAPFVLVAVVFCVFGVIGGRASLECPPCEEPTIHSPGNEDYGAAGPEAGVLTFDASEEELSGLIDTETSQKSDFQDLRIEWTEEEYILRISEAGEVSYDTEKYTREEVLIEALLSVLQVEAGSDLTAEDLKWPEDE